MKILYVLSGLILENSSPRNPKLLMFIVSDLEPPEKFRRTSMVACFGFCSKMFSTSKIFFSSVNNPSEYIPKKPAKIANDDKNAIPMNIVILIFPFIFKI